MHRTDIERLNQAIADRQPLALATWLAGGEQKLLQPPGPDPSDQLGQALAQGFRTDRSATLTIDGAEVFIRIFNPALRMVIIGAVHIAQALIPMARQVGYEIIVIDPRTAFASEERFTGVTLDARWPDEALAEIAVDARTAFIALTHDPKIDDPALTIALGQDPFYIGALGSRRTHAARLERLTAAGLSETQLARIQAPIGLDIGAVGADEIAVSIIAEVTAALRGKLAGST